MSLEAQAKLLRALQERKITRLGGKKSITVDFRVVAATNKDLREEIKNHTFREDLFYRLNVVHINMPPLREIKEDILVIAKHFLDNYSQEFGKSSVRLSKNATKYFEGYSWPGNVRELENEIKRALIITDDNEIKQSDLSQHLVQKNKETVLSSSLEIGDDSLPMKKIVEQIEIKMINNALLRTQGNKQKASELLGITRQGLFKKIKRYGL